jgi:WD40 repeat protein
MILKSLVIVSRKCLFCLALIWLSAITHIPVEGQTPDQDALAPITAANAATLQEIAALDPKSGAPIPTIVWSADSHTLYSGGKDTNTVIIWDISTGRQKFALDAEYSAFAVSSDGALIAVNSSSDLGGVTIYDMQTHAVKAFLHCSGGSLQIAFSPTNSKLLVVSTEGGNAIPPRLDFWIIKAKMQIDTTYAEPCAPDYQVRAAGSVPFILFNPNGQSFLYGSRLLDVSTLKQINLFKDVPDYGLTAAAFSPDGKLLATYLQSSHNITISGSLWSIQNNRPLATLDLTQGATITAIEIAGLAFSPNGQLLAVRGYGMSKDAYSSLIWVWDATTYKLITLLEGQSDSSIEGSLAFSPDGKRLAVADSVIHIYAVAK